MTFLLSASDSSSVVESFLIRRLLFLRGGTGSLSLLLVSLLSLVVGRGAWWWLVSIFPVSEVSEV